MKWDLDIWRSPAPMDSTWLLLTQRERRAFYLSGRESWGASKIWHTHPPLPSHSLQRSSAREADRRHVLLAHRRIINLRLSIKQDHTANMKYTHCVEHLIKYWLQTYMNLPHQIKPPVGGPPLIRGRLKWKWGRRSSRHGCRVHISCVINLFILLSSCSLPAWGRAL